MDVYKDGQIYNQKSFVQQLAKFLESPFKEDRKFVTQFLARLTRDKIDECEDCLN